MIYCDYDEHFQKIRTNNRIISIPIFKNTCVNCEFKKECGLHKFNNPRKNNELIIDNLLDVKYFLKESKKEAIQIQKDIDDGYYSDTYSYKLMSLNEAPLDGVVFEVKGFDTTMYSVDEYLKLYPNDIDKRKLVGVKGIDKPSDVCVGLDIEELESDLEYIDDELRKYNVKNKVIKGEL